MPTRVLLLMACSATMFHGTSGFSIPAFFNARGLPAATSGAAALQRPDVETPRSWSVGGKSMPWQRQTEKRRVAMTMTETEVRNLVRSPLASCCSPVCSRLFEIYGTSVMDPA